MKIKFLVLAVAMAGATPVAKGAIVFPSSPGLFIYDSSTAASQYVPITSGIATFAGSVGNYSLAISTGQTIAGGSSPVIDLDVAATRISANATSLLIFYSDGGFGSSVGTYALNTYLSSGPISTFAFLDNGNNPFGMTTSLGGSLDAPGVITHNAAGAANASFPYSLTIEDIITGNIVSVDSTLGITVVPEPGAMSLMLLGGVLACSLVYFRRRRAA